MTTDLLDRLVGRIGQPLSAGGPALAPDPVNRPMIRHWVDALDDRNPVYLDEAAAAASRHGGIVAPPAMLQTWTMGRPALTGIAERGGSAAALDPDSPLVTIRAAGFTGTLATDSMLEFDRYLRPGDRLTAATALEAVSALKATRLGAGHFVTWSTTYTTVDGEPVGRQTFRVLMFAPGAAGPASGDGAAGIGATTAASAPAGRVDDEGAGVEDLPALDLPLTTTLVVAGAIASRDFMPAHHDREFARAQGAPDVFLNILTSTGNVSRNVTDWAGPDARLRRISMRLGGPGVPGDTLRFRGRSPHPAAGSPTRQVGVEADTARGRHLAATVELSLRD